MAEASYPDDNQFAGLVEAATAAADQEVEWSHNESAGTSGHPGFGRDESHGAPPNAYPILHSGQYDPSLRDMRNGNEPEAFTRPHPRKRKRGTNSVGIEVHPTHGQAAGQPPPQPSSLNPTSAATVHPAAALFRAPSTSSKKHTRPPMSKLFSSLHLPPEEFLHLQSAAKAYMLGDDHPERRDCVGQRGKTDSDMVKLKLWNCVQEFLDREGNGERFFGVNARKADSENVAGTMMWPRDAQQIIKTCVPLLRRMVTNERQRQYAVESRKGGGEKKIEAPAANAHQEEEQAPRATVDDTDNPYTFTLEKIDIFGDELLPDPREASEWYTVYNSDAALDKIFIKSGFPRVLFLPLIANIDGHCRLYHGDTGPFCSDSCKTRLVERLLELSIYQQHAPAGDPSETIREVFNVILTHLVLTRYWNKRTADGTGASGAEVTTAMKTPGADRSNTRKKPASRAPGTVSTTSNDQPSNNSLQLLINIVHEDKCVLPSFDILSSKCPDLEGLRAQIQNHYSLATLQEKQVVALSEARLKVWLPDGLVRVEDDGQWMVALLSAEKVEWMGGQIRVLLET